MLCHEYGWTLDQCFECTQEQVQLLTEAMSERKMKELEQDAGMHGAKIEKSRQNKGLDLTENLDRDWNRLKARGFNIKDK